MEAEHQKSHDQLVMGGMVRINLVVIVREIASTIQNCIIPISLNLKPMAKEFAEHIILLRLHNFIPSNREPMNKYRKIPKA